MPLGRWCWTAGASLPTPNVVGSELLMGCCQLLSDDACISPIWIRGRQGAQVHSRSSLLLHAAAEVTRSSAAPWKFRFPATVGLVVVGVFFAATDSPCKNRAGSRNCSLRWGSRHSSAHLRGPQSSVLLSCRHACRHGPARIGGQSFSGTISPDFHFPQFCRRMSSHVFPCSLQYTTKIVFAYDIYRQFLLKSLVMIFTNVCYKNPR